MSFGLGCTFFFRPPFQKVVQAHRRSIEVFPDIFGEQCLPAAAYDG